MNPKEVTSKTNLIDYLHYLRKNLQEKPTEWNNISLADYLEAIEAWLIDSRALPETADWRMAAELFFAGKIYE